MAGLPKLGSYFGPDPKNLERAVKLYPESCFVSKVSSSSENALEQLINQFSQPLAFLRELIQNSLDASTSLIEVTVGYDEDSECCFVRVSDNGHGMDRHTIDNRLTKLFASTKENDFTKIGKFGIGFVSIFAMKPELVVLETGQHGESWRILFLPDRSFERRELSHPVEGTNITIFTPKGPNELPKLEADCLETVIYWCKYSEIDITFNGDPVNQTFDLHSEQYRYRAKVEGSEVVLSPSNEESGFQGYYNRGLTLLEGAGSPYPHLRFILRSRYLEHTLSRDNIRRDEGYEKAMELVRAAAYEEMPRDLFQLLAERPSEQLWNVARSALKMDPSLARKVNRIAVFPTRDDNKTTLKEIGKLVYHASNIDALWEDAEAAGFIVLRVEDPRRCRMLNFLNECGVQTEELTSAFFHYRSATPVGAEMELLSALKKATGQLFARPFLVDSLNVPAMWKTRFCAYLHPQKKLEDTTARKKGWREAIGLRRDHPYWTRILKLYSAQPELALSLMIRMVNLELNVDRKAESRAFGQLLSSAKERSR